MKALVTGSSGQVGRYLVDLLAERGADVVALDRMPVPHEDPAPGVGTFRFFQGDILNFEFVRDLLVTESFDAVFHLAGLNPFALPADIYRVNVVGTATLLQALGSTETPGCKIVVMSSSAVYGATRDDPIAETSPPAPLTHYGVSKYCMEAMSSVAMSKPAHIIIARPFNIVGPGQRAPMLHSTVASQLVRIERGMQPPTLQLGTLGDYRDFIDVRDVADGLISLAKHGKAGEAYNICTGCAVQVREFVKAMCAMCPVEVHLVENDLNRPRTELPRQRGSYEKIRAASDWAPQIPLAASLEDTLRYWRELI